MGATTPSQPTYEPMLTQRASWHLRPWIAAVSHLVHGARCTSWRCKHRHTTALELRSIAPLLPFWRRVGLQELGMAEVHVGTPPFAITRGRACGVPLPHLHQLMLDSWSLGTLVANQQRMSESRRATGR